MKEPICLLVEHGYDHSMGDFEIYHLWDGEKVYTEGGVFINRNNGLLTFVILSWPFVGWVMLLALWKKRRPA